MKRLLLMLSLVVGLASTALAETYTDVIDATFLGVTKGSQAISKEFSSENSGITYYVNSTSYKNKTNLGFQLDGSGKDSRKILVVKNDNNLVATKVVVTGQGSSTSKDRTFTVYGKKSVYTSDESADAEATELSTVTKVFSSFTASADLELSDKTMFALGFAAPGGIMYLKSIEITWETAEGGDVPTPVAPKLPVVTFGDVTAENNGEYEVVEGTEVSVTSTGADYLLVTNTTDLTEERIEGNTYSFAVNADDIWEFTGVNETGSSETFTVSFTAVPAPKTGGVVYTLVKSASELVAGETYAIACAEVNKAMSNANQANYRESVDANIANGSFEANDNVLAFTLQKSSTSDAWSMSTVNYAGTDGYFNLSTSKTEFKISATPTYYSVSIDGDANAKIVSGSRSIQYNTDNGRFASYTTNNTSFTTGKAVQLYREEVVAPGIYFNGEQLQAGASPELKAGDKIVIRGHEANELHYKLLNSAMRAPSANLDGWFKHDSNEYEYEVPEGFENESISLAAKAVNNGKESAPVQFVVSEGTMTGVAGVEAEAAEAQTEWFTLQGVRVAAPAEGGLYIRRQGSKVEKVVL